MGYYGVDTLRKGASLGDGHFAWRLALYRATRPVWGGGRLHTGDYFMKMNQILLNV